ncbi:MAG: hypothetical protein HFE86_01440 [Clostridiales bacterium]|nr:hypothetical protein [Clostridiales bacterium]
MRNRFCICILAGLLTLTLVGCATGTSADLSSDAGSVKADADTAPAGKNMSVRLDETLDLTGKKIKPSYTVSDGMAPCETLAELGEKSTDVVQGKIVGVEYFHMTTMPYTKIDIQVQETLKGELQTGDTVSAYKLGGYIQLKHSDPDIQERYPEITEAEMENTVFDYRIDGDPHPAVGQEGVFFLRPKLGDMPEGLYLITDGYDGQFIKRADGNYARHYDGNASFEQEQGLSGYSLDDPASAYETDRSQAKGLNGVLSYESIKADLAK